MKHTKSLMLDSGAFGAWSRGKIIDVNDYVSFCRRFPMIDYYINLDVIPGNKQESCDGVRLSAESIECACRESWKNYLRMLKHLPMEKVLPVYHYGESVKWLEKYLGLGVPFLAIGGMVHIGTKAKCDWLKRVVRPVVCDSNDSLAVRTHLLGATNHRMMCCWEWESVDSAAWVIQAGLGTIYVPRFRGGQFDYSTPPHQISFSSRFPKKVIGGFGLAVGGNRDSGFGVVEAGGSHAHILSLSPLVRKCVDRYLAMHRLSLGEWELRNVSAGYKLEKGRELWANKEKMQVIHVLRKGLLNSNLMRKWLNMKYYQEVNAALSVKRIHLAGNGTSAKIEHDMKYRLMSFVDVCSKAGEKYIHYFFEQGD